MVRHRTFDDELTLVLEDQVNGRAVEVSRTTILCNVESVHASEFYVANQHGMRPEKTFIIHSFEYSGEEVVVFKGQSYRVIRTYENEYDEIELTAERKVGR